MFGHDPRLPLAELLKHKLRYLGTEESMVSLQALRNMYMIVAENLQKTRERNARSGTLAPTKWAHVMHLKPLLRADEVIDHLPTGNNFARKTKLALDPHKIPDLQWQRATQLNTQTTTP